MVRISKRGKVIAFHLAIFLAVSFSSNFSCAQSSNEFQAYIWVDNSSYSEGDTLTIRFTISTTSPPSSYSSIASVSIIDYYPNADSKYLVQNRSCTIGAICYYEDTVNCIGGEGVQTLELIAEIYTITETVIVKSTCSFLVQCDRDKIPPDISGVELVQPVNTILPTGNPTFVWRIPLTDYEDVASWILDYASDNQFQQNRRTISGLINISTIISNNYASISYTLPVSQTLTNGTWYWHLSAKDAAGNQSSYTAAKKFDVNVEVSPVKVLLSSPPNGFTDVPARPTFSWLPAKGATSYWLQVDSSSSFSSPEINQDGITATSFMAPSELDPGTYYWRVNSNATNAQWSDTWSFTIPREVPKQVGLLSPSSGAQDMPPRLLFQWQALEGAISYTLEVSADMQFTSLVVEKTGLTSISWGRAADWDSNDPSQLEDGTYYWRVSSDIENSTSAIWNFTVKTQPEQGGKVAITVIVTNLNHDPIAGATVTMKKDGDTKGTGSTDTSGTITLSNLDSGTYELEVTASGYGSYTETVNLSSNMYKNITLYRGGVIHGYVYYNNTTNPAANVAVRIYETETQYQTVSDVTDTNGYFAVDNLVENKVYYIVVENYEDQKKQGIIPVDAPTTANALTVIIKTEGEIIGVVQDDDGSPLPGAKVTLRDSRDQFINSTSTNDIGTFTFKVTPGQFYVEVTMTGYEDYRGSIFTVEYKEIEDLGLITLHSRLGVLKITVHNENDEPLDAIVTVRDVAGNVIDTISVTGGTASEKIVVGIYTLEAEAAGYQPQIADKISIGSGDTVSQDFTLTFSPGSLRIYIEDPEGMPISGAEVLLDGVSAGTSDQTGLSTVSNVSPGDHTIQVVRHGFADYAEVHTVDPGETLILEITMERTSNMWLYILSLLIIGAGIAAFKYINSILSVILKKKTSSPLFCPYCGKRVGNNWKTCLYCGGDLDKTRIYDDDTRIY